MIEYLLKCLCGQLDFDSGFLYYEGRMISNSGKTGAFKSNYTLINDHSSFIKTLTLAENVFAPSGDNTILFKKKEFGI